MGCFLGCFGGDKDRKRVKKRINRVNPNDKRKEIQKVQQQSIISAETKTAPDNLIPELLNKPKEEEKSSPSPRKRVTFDSNVTTYEHVLVDESTDSLPGDVKAFKEEKGEDETSMVSSVASYPPNHRYHNIREEDELEEEYGDSDLDDIDDLDDYDDDYDFDSQQVWSESVLTSSMESTTEHSQSQLINEEVESQQVQTGVAENAVERLGQKRNARDRSVYVNSVLNPIENIAQWKVVKSKGTKPQKDNNKLVQELDKSSHGIQEIAVNASLSNWLVPSDAKKMNHNELENMSQGSNSVMSFEDRPILGALTIDELKQISTPRKSPSRSIDEIPIIGTVGTYWNHGGSTHSPESVSACKGISSTSRKHREAFVK